MEFSCEKNTLLRTLSIANDIIESKNPVSIMANVFIKAENDTLLIRATNFKIYYETSIPALVNISGETTTFCDRLLNIIRNFPDGDVKISEESQDQLIIEPQTSNLKFKLRTISADNYPELPRVERDLYFNIPVDRLFDIINQTIFAVSVDESRYAMTGMLFEKENDTLSVVATDGKRLSFCKDDLADGINEFKPVIVPPKIFSIVKKMGSAEGELAVAITENQMFIEFGNDKISTALIEGPFPQYKRVIPTNQEYRAKVNKKVLFERLKQVSVLIEESSRVYIELEENKLVLRTDKSDVGEAEGYIPCEYSGPSIQIALNYTYLLDPLKIISTEEVSIQFTEATRAISLNSVPEKEYFHIIMPMNLVE